MAPIGIELAKIFNLVTIDDNIINCNIVIFKILDNSILIGRNSKTPTLKNAECLSGGQVKWSVAEESVED